MEQEITAKCYPIHILFDKHGKEMSRALMKAHLLTGGDSHSKIGAKHAAVKMEPEK